MSIHPIQEKLLLRHNSLIINNFHSVSPPLSIPSNDTARFDKSGNNSNYANQSVSGKFIQPKHKKNSFSSSACLQQFSKKSSFRLKSSRKNSFNELFNQLKSPRKSITNLKSFSKQILANQSPTNQIFENQTIKTILNRPFSISPRLTSAATYRDHNRNSKGSSNMQSFEENLMVYQEFKNQIKDLLNEKNMISIDTFRNDLSNNQSTFKQSQQGSSPKSHRVLNGYNRLLTARASMNDLQKETSINIANIKDTKLTNMQSPKNNTLLSKRDKNHGVKGSDELNYENDHPKKIKNDPNIDNDNEVEILSRIGANIFNGFKQKLGLYNKFYSNYLVEPDQKFQSRNDLNIRIESKIPWLHQPQNQITTMNKSSVMKKSTKVRPTLISNIDNGKINDPNIHQAINNMGPKTKKIQLQLNELEKVKMLQLMGTMNSAKAKTSKEEDEVLSVDQNRRKIESMREQMAGSEMTLSKAEIEFLKSVKNGLENSVEIILNKNPEFVNIRDLMKETPLHWAAKRGYERIVTILLKYKADVLAVDLANRTPRDIAILNDYNKIALTLMYEEERRKKSDELANR